MKRYRFGYVFEGIGSGRHTHTRWAPVKIHTETLASHVFVDVWHCGQRKNGLLCPASMCQRDVYENFVCYHLIFTQHLGHKAIIPGNMHTWSLPKMFMFLLSAKRKLSTNCMRWGASARLSARERVHRIHAKETRKKRKTKSCRTLHVNLSIRQGICHQPSKARTFVRTPLPYDNTSHQRRQCRKYIVSWKFIFYQQLPHANQKKQKNCTYKAFQQNCDAKWWRQQTHLRSSNYTFAFVKCHGWDALSSPFPSFSNVLGLKRVCIFISVLCSFGCLFFFFSFSSSPRTVRVKQATKAFGHVHLSHERTNTHWALNNVDVKQCTVGGFSTWIAALLYATTECNERIVFVYNISSNRARPIVVCRSIFRLWNVVLFICLHLCFFFRSLRWQFSQWKRKNCVCMPPSTTNIGMLSPQFVSVCGHNLLFARAHTQCCVSPYLNVLHGCWQHQCSPLNY